MLIPETRESPTRARHFHCPPFRRASLRPRAASGFATSSRPGCIKNCRRPRARKSTPMARLLATMTQHQMTVLGEQVILESAPRIRTFVLTGDTSVFYTNNAALTRSPYDRRFLCRERRHDLDTPDRSSSRSADCRTRLHLSLRQLLPRWISRVSASGPASSGTRTTSRESGSLRTTISSTCSIAIVKRSCAITSSRSAHKRVFLWAVPKLWLPARPHGGTGRTGISAAGSSGNVPGLSTSSDTFARRRVLLSLCRLCITTTPAEWIVTRSFR